MTTFEKLDSEELTDIELESEAGVFRIRENEEREVTVELENKEGKKFVLNDLLPEGWNIVSHYRTAVDYPQKELLISRTEIEQEGWKYFLSLLHEMGHIFEFENSDISDENNPIRKRELFWMQEGVGTITPEGKQEFERIMSKSERDAWAYALREFRKIVEELGIDMEKTFGSSKSLRGYVHEFLLEYKESGEDSIKKLSIPEVEKEKLLEEISNLYTHKDVRK